MITNDNQPILPPLPQHCYCFTTTTTTYHITSTWLFLAPSISMLDPLQYFCYTSSSMLLVHSSIKSIPILIIMIFNELYFDCVINFSINITISVNFFDTALLHYRIHIIVVHHICYLINLFITICHQVSSGNEHSLIYHQGHLWNLAWIINFDLFISSRFVICVRELLISLILSLCCLYLYCCFYLVFIFIGFYHGFFSHVREETINFYSSPQLYFMVYHVISIFVLLFIALSSLHLCYCQCCWQHELQLKMEIEMDLVISSFDSGYLD